MKTFSRAGILGAGIFLQGCGMTVVSRRSSRVDSGHRHGAGRSGNGDIRHRHGDNVSQHPVRNVERTNIHESTLYETNVHRNYTARNNVNRAVVSCRDSSNDA
jgi:hypothetical protein